MVLEDRSDKQEGHVEQLGSECKSAEYPEDVAESSAEGQSGIRGFLVFLGAIKFGAKLRGIPGLLTQDAPDIMSWFAVQHSAMSDARASV